MSLVKTLLETYGRKIEQLTVVPSDGGRFEITVDGKLVYSKLEEGRFPEEEEALALIDGKPGKAGRK